MVHASKSLTYGKDTKRIIHVAEVVDGVSEDILLHFAFVPISKKKFLFMTLRTKLSANFSRGTKKRSDEFVIDD